MPEKLTAKKLESLKPPTSGRLQITDSDTKGLTYRLTAKGESSWSLQMRIDGKVSRFTIGPYPNISLSQARNRAARMRVEILDGKNPTAEKRKAKAKAQAIVSIQDALDAYDKQHLKPNMKRGEERMRQLKEIFKGKTKRPIADVSRVELQSFLDKKAKTAPVHANRMRAAMTAFLQWCFERGFIDGNPALATKKAAKEAARERVLTNEELYAIWKACNDMPPLWCRMVRLLILTAQRRTEVGSMRWDALDLENKRWEIASEDTKNQRPHIVHLSTYAIELLREQEKEKIHGSPYVFSSRKNTPVSTFSKNKIELDKLCKVPDWRFHDFRRTFATQMAENGYDEALVDRILNHVAAGSRASTVARVYNRAVRLEERKEVLDAWAWFVTKELPELVEKDD